MIGKMPMMPQASINMSDVRDIAKIHVLALENEKANGNSKRLREVANYKAKYKKDSLDNQHLKNISQTL